MRMQLRPIAVGIVSLGLAAALTACGEAGGGDSGDGDGNGGGAEGKESGTIGLLLPENSTTRYESFDRPSIEGKIAELCSDCKVQYNNANEDTALQKQQFDAMLTQGVDVIILDAVDSASTASWVEEAAAQGVPVVAYDRLAEGDVVAYISYDNYEVGRLQGQALLEALGEDAEGAGVVMINGSPTDPNAAMFKAGAHDVLDGVVDIVYESDVDKWDAALANEDVAGAVESLGSDAIDAVYSANDGMAAGVITALHAADLHDLVVGGQDAELAGLQRIIAGEQTFTIYKALVPQGELTAEVAVRVLRGEDFSDLTPDTIDSPTTEGVPSALLTAVTVTTDTINDTVIADGFYTAEAICTRDYAAACTAAGIG